MNEMWSKLSDAGLTDTIKWSLVDRWHSHPAFIDALAGRYLAPTPNYNSLLLPSPVLSYALVERERDRTGAEHSRFPAECSTAMAEVPSAPMSPSCAPLSARASTPDLA